MPEPVISLNTDIGEGYGAWRIADDAALLGTVTDANMACGFHAGDPDIMRQTCETAARNGVGIGAQVGFHDIIGFGRRFIEISRASLTNDLIYQLGALSAFANLAGSPVAYVKAHGALYHAAVQHEEYAAAVIDAILSVDESLPFLCQPGTPFTARAEDAGLRIIREGYIDRAYQPNGLLVPRGAPGAMVTDLDEACRRAVAMAQAGQVTAIDGSVIEMPVDSVCVHSDSPGAAEVARAVRAALVDAGITLSRIG